MWMLSAWLTVVLPMAVVASALFVHGWLWPRSFLFGRVMWHGDGLGDAVALTLEGDAEPAVVEAVMRVLSERDVLATWFVSGTHVVRWPGVVASWVEQGHGLGVTGWHGRAARWGDRPSGWRAWLDRCDDAVQEVAGFRPVLVRPIKGIKTPTMMREIAFGGQHAVAWSVRGSARGSVRRKTRALRRCGAALPGAVVSITLDADDAEASAAWVDALMQAWERRGLRVVRLSRLLGAGDRR